MSNKKAFALLLLALPLMSAIASPVSALWQEVETWDDELRIPVWESVETWNDSLQIAVTVGPPVLSSPENDNTIYDDTPSFFWFVGANAANHRFLLDDDEAFSSPIENVWLGGSTTTYTVTTPLADDNYWWKVIAISADIENSSENWTFELLTPIVEEWYTVESWGDYLYTFSLGDGTVGNPYIITTVEGLQAMKDNLIAHYALGNDIDASDTVNWNGGAGFEPIGNNTNTFTGSFDGRKHWIFNLYINRPDTDYIGLFGYIFTGAVVKNVGLESVNMSGLDEGHDIGGLIGSNFQGIVDNSYTTGFVSGYLHVGGLVGLNNGTISNCYSTCSVNGTTQTGGLVGYNSGTVTDSYSTGSVSGADVDGLIGDNAFGDGTAYNSFWDNETSGQSTSAGGTGKTTDNMKNVRTYTDNTWSTGLDNAWDFMRNPYYDTENEDIWDIDGVTNDGYPFFIFFDMWWAEVENWDDHLQSTSWQTVENWDDHLEVVPVAPGLSDRDVWVMFVLRVLFSFGPLGFVAWKFTKIRDPTTGFEAVAWIGVSFIALVVLWVVADAIEWMLYWV